MELDIERWAVSNKDMELSSQVVDCKKFILHVAKMIGTVLQNVGTSVLSGYSRTSDSLEVARCMNPQQNRTAESKTCTMSNSAQTLHNQCRSPAVVEEYG